MQSEGPAERLLKNTLIALHVVTTSSLTATPSPEASLQIPRVKTPVT